MITGILFMLTLGSISLLKIIDRNHKWFDDPLKARTRAFAVSTLLAVVTVGSALVEWIF